MTRLYAIETPLPEGRDLVREAAAQWLGDARAGDWPQALMDLAATTCRPKAPMCMLCPLREACLAFARGEQERFPVKLAKVAKPRRHGVAFLIVNGDRILVERRPDKGLLGGMLGLPHTEWRGEAYRAAEVSPPVAATEVGGYEHVFTHFALSQAVWRGQATDAQIAELLRRHNSWQMLPIADQKALPTVFRKALAYL